MTDNRRPAPRPGRATIHEIPEPSLEPALAFAPRAVEPEKLRSLFEAARWAASTGNSQPWFYIVAAKDSQPENFQRALECLVELNQGWAKNAPVLAFSVARTSFENGKHNRHALHDTGAASASLCVEATSLELEVHQMAGIDQEKVRRTFGVPEGYEVVAGMAIGYPGDPQSLPEPLRQREVGPRERKPLDSLCFFQRLEAILAACRQALGKFLGERGKRPRNCRCVRFCGSIPEQPRRRHLRVREYVTLGRTGLRVSPLCLGTMTFGTEWGFGAEENVSKQMFDRYIDAGGDFVDTADGYTNGHSEELVGKFVAERKLLLTAP